MEFKLLRKPRPPKMHRVDIARVPEPEDFGFDDSIDTDLSSIKTTDRDLIDPNLYIKINSNINKQNNNNSTAAETAHMMSVRFEPNVLNDSSGKEEHFSLPNLVKNPADQPPGQLFQMAREKFIAIPYEQSAGIKRLCNTVCTTSRASVLEAAQKEDTFSSNLNANVMKKSSSFSGKKFVSRLPTIKSAVNLQLDEQIKPPSQPNTIQSALPHRNPGYLKKIKPLGPDPLPPRALRLHKEDLEIKKIIYSNLTYDDMQVYRSEPLQTNENSFMLNDFLCNPDDLRMSRPIVIENSLRKAIVSDYTTNQIETLLAERVNSEKSSNQVCSFSQSFLQVGWIFLTHLPICSISKVSIQTLVPDIETFENRKPFRQALIEMASFFKEELSQNTSNFQLFLSLLPPNQLIRAFDFQTFRSRPSSTRCLDGSLMAQRRSSSFTKRKRTSPTARTLAIEVNSSRSPTRNRTNQRTKSRRLTLPSLTAC